MIPRKFCEIMLPPLVLLFILGPALAENDGYHSYQASLKKSKRSIPAENPELLQSFWYREARDVLIEKLNQKINTNVARNVIFFLGDGMSISTLAATRVYLGGEEKQLSFEKFPHVGLSKTYCVDKQVADSACTATAYLGGVKANLATIGVSASVQHNNCSSMNDPNNHVDSIASWSQLKNKKTGLITTTRVTHASPAGLYAHTANRDWEADQDVLKDNEDPTRCADIAKQLIYQKTGRSLDVVMGGGRSNFLPAKYEDKEGFEGSRKDGLNLIEAWKDFKNSSRAKYVWNRDQLLNIPEDTESILGLFAPSHIDFKLDRKTELVPSLPEMVESAIKVLNKGENGYFLFVEGGRIDMAHHETKAMKAFEETKEFSEAVQRAVDMTDDEETLIIVTSDHSHTMTISGYPERKNDILGIAGMGNDNKPYTTINYANGPGYKQKNRLARYDAAEDNFHSKNYQYPSVFPLESETHGGEDVAIFAKGPWSHLFTGVIEENVIPHLIAFASCVGNYSVCDISKPS